MTDNNATQKTPDNSQKMPTPLRCLTGAIISGGLAYAAYSLFSSIVTTFAAKPIHSHNPIVLNIASAVRTLVMGIMALAAGVFAMVAVGLVALAVQLTIQQFTKKESV